MADAPITRRTLVRVGGAALAAVALPDGGICFAKERNPLTPELGASPQAFDAAVYVADLRAAGLSVHAVRGVGQRPAYCIGPDAHGAFGRPHREVMARWSDALDACPDHVERVVAHLAGAGM